MVRRLFAVLLALAGICLPLEQASAHPIHMSYTEMHHSPDNETVEVFVRVYANDFSAAAARAARVRLRADSLIDLQSAMAYLSVNLQMIDQSARALSLTPCGVVRAQDMLRFCFRVRVKGPLASVRIRNSIMTDLFSDQVNVVQSVSPEGRSSRLFVRGDGWKTI